MALNSIEELVADIRQGKMVILMDDEDRENEGDLVIPGSMASADAINFMARFGRGLICLAMTGEQVDKLMDKGRDLVESASELIRERPLAAFGVAFAAGWIISKLGRSDK